MEATGAPDVSRAPVRLDGSRAPVGLSERPGYLQQEGEQLYVVRHVARAPRRGRVLLAGPLGDERMHAYITWVRWARRLAAAGFEVLRFDYRGLGESTGRFEDQTLEGWTHDLQRALGHLETSTPAGGPTVLCGLRMGGLLAARVFAEGRADALLLWGPPASGRAMLTALLRRKLAEAMMQGLREQDRDRAWYVAQLEAGRTVEVNGFRWSGRLWDSSADFPLAIPAPEEKRPWRLVRFDGTTPVPPDAEAHLAAVQVGRPPFWAMSQYLLPEVGTLLDDSAGWLLGLAPR